MYYVCLLLGTEAGFQTGGVPRLGREGLTVGLMVWGSILGRVFGETPLPGVPFNLSSPIGGCPTHPPPPPDLFSKMKKTSVRGTALQAVIIYNVSTSAVKEVCSP